ncbi:MAG TPA: hypothetical protein PKK11_02035 [Methanothrix sp.]|nr:hypothetical protein [Methanothrix sp.]
MVENCDFQISMLLKDAVYLRLSNNDRSLISDFIFISPAHPGRVQSKESDLFVSNFYPFNVGIIRRLLSGISLQEVRKCFKRLQETGSFAIIRKPILNLRLGGQRLLEASRKHLKLPSVQVMISGHDEKVLRSQSACIQYRLKKLLLCCLILFRFSTVGQIAAEDNKIYFF